MMHLTVDVRCRRRRDVPSSRAHHASSCLRQHKMLRLRPVLLLAHKAGGRDFVYVWSAEKQVPLRPVQPMQYSSVSSAGESPQRNVPRLQPTSMPTAAAVVRCGLSRFAFSARAKQSHNQLLTTQAPQPTDPPPTATNDTMDCACCHRGTVSACNAVHVSLPATPLVLSANFESSQQLSSALCVDCARDVLTRGC